MSRILLKTGNRDVFGVTSAGCWKMLLKNVSYPESLVSLERREWGNYYGYLVSYKNHGTVVATSKDDESKVWNALLAGIQRAESLNGQIKAIEKGDIGKVNYDLERLRLKEKRLELENRATDLALAEIEAERKALHDEYDHLQANWLFCTPKLGVMRL